MQQERRGGATFALADIGWVDFETKSELSLPEAGSARYTMNAAAIMCAWAIGDSPVNITAVSAFPGRLAWLDMPLEFRKHHLRVTKGEATWAAWNASFDRSVWNYSANNFHILEHQYIIDPMVQAVASGLAPDLKMAARQCGGGELKDERGKLLLKMFCLPGATATPQSHPKEWRELLAYAGQDIEAMRTVFKHTRQLPIAEWREYWAMEGVNARGINIDLLMAVHAARLAAEDRVASGRELAGLTSGAIDSVGQVKRMVQWMLPQLPPDGAGILTKREEEVGEDGELVKPAKYQLSRQRLEKLIPYCEAVLPKNTALRRVLEIRHYGGSATPAKYKRMLAQHVNGVLYNQYVFNGAGQTGRASSRGVQVHNLARKTLPYEHEAVEALLNGVPYRQFATVGDNAPVSRKLSLLIRPVFVPEDGNVFVWSDWSQIEARILPWLAGESIGAVKRLQDFRDSDADPSLPDLYKRSAASIFHMPIEKVGDDERQRGKIAELALGFGGGVGALQGMAAGYGVYINDLDAQAIVKAWRAANTWCVAFWGRHDDQGSSGVWGAINQALERPEKRQYVGRVSYIYWPAYLGGTLFARLPSGRLLSYRNIKYERVEDLDDDDQPTGTFSTKLRFSRGHAGRTNLWHGMAVENLVQATAADVLRGTLRRLEDDRHDVRLHTHDEILLECPEEVAGGVAIALREVMTRGFEWSAGLPLVSHETVAPYYSKLED